MIARAAATALVTAVLVAGCSSAGPAPGRSGGSSVAAPGSTTPTPTPVSAAPGTSAPVTTPAAVLSSPPTTPNLTATAPAGTGTTGPPVTSTGPRSTCTSLVIRVIRGSAAPGYEFAALQFVNTGSARCVLNGYPAVGLRLHGAALGQPSKPASTASSRFVLEPGATAESRLKDFSSCQAPLSDEIRVVAPGSSISLTRPGQLRACTLRVYPLSTPE